MPDWFFHYSMGTPTLKECGTALENEIARSDAAFLSASVIHRNLFVLSLFMSVKGKGKSTPRVQTALGIEMSLMKKKQLYMNWIQNELNSFSEACGDL